jgi:hypothetical protein
MTTKKDWLRFAAEVSARPDLTFVISILFGVVALGDYVLAYFTGHLTMINVAFALAGVSAILFGLWDYQRNEHHALKEADDNLNNTLRTPVAVPRITLPKNYIDSGYTLVTGTKGHGFWSADLSDRLFERSLTGTLQGPIKLRKGPFHGKGNLRRSVGAKEAIAALEAGKRFSNDQKVRLLSDIFTDCGAGQAVELQDTDYLASRSSNDLAFERIELRTRGLDNRNEARSELLYNGLSFFLNEETDHSVFRGFGDSECSNQLGVSTLALTADGYLLLVDQLKGGLESADLIAPSGSGSLDWDDLPSNAARHDFWNWIVKASKRELREELGIAVEHLPRAYRRPTRDQLKSLAAISIETVLIGFGGMLHRGGKPDFFFLSKLSCTIDELREKAKYSADEKLLSRRCEVTGEQKLEAPTCAALLQLIARNQSDRDSFPLQLAYVMLASLCRSKPRKLEAFLPRC